MKALIAYASNSGSTYLTSLIIQEVLLAHSPQIHVKKAIEVGALDVLDYSLILLGSPSWGVDGKEGQPQETMSELLTRLKSANLAGKHFALFGCGDSSYLSFCGAVDVLEDFVKEVKGVQLVPSLRLDSFYFDLEKNKQLTDAWARQLIDSLPVSQII